ncbi:MAG: CoA transferase [Deltaproteobacteria bacterium]|nr:CoA transferase [Deltaproteobacteria bacterium]
MKEQSFLSPYRILDLTDEKGLICGKFLRDLGAKVIKIEKPGGDPARNIGPFYHDIQDPEKSLFWFSLNTGKKGITLDITRPKGKEIFRELVKGADCVLESFPPGTLDGLELGYKALCLIKSDLIMTSITPFGDKGPYRDYKGSDLILWALSGLLFICGDPDRPPVRISLEQSYLHAGADGAAGTVMALFHRGRSGKGQQVQVSILKAMERVAYTAHILWDARGKILRRPGSALRIPPLGTKTPLIWSCKDGYVAFYLFGGAMGAVSNPALTQWLDEEGLASEVMKAMDWPKFDIGTTLQEDIDRHIVGPIAEFFKGRTKKELWEGGIKRRVMVYPVNDAHGVLNDQQLKERNFWARVAHTHLEDTLDYPGPFIKVEGELCQVRGRAPLIGEHNEEIYVNELGLSGEDLVRLKAEGVI